MTEKIGLVKNPLTVIAIFAGIAEVSGTIVLPFIAEDNQIIFIYFLLFFPSILVILFFITLNFNNKALYAPSDFNNEENYIKIFRYDVSKQENIEVKVSKEDVIKMINANITSLRNSYEIKIEKVDSELKLIKDLIIAKSLSETEQSELESEIEEIEIEDEYYDDEGTQHGLVTINKFPNADKFRASLSKKGYYVEVYEIDYNIDYSLKGNKSIWLGYKYPFREAKEIILLAKEFYPHLSYIDYSDYNSSPPPYIHHQIFIGGSTDTAVERDIKPLQIKDWEKLKTIDNPKEFERFIKSFT